MTGRQVSKRLGITPGRLSQLAGECPSIYKPRAWTAKALATAKADLLRRRSEANNSTGTVHSETDEARALEELPLKAREQVRLIIARRVMLEMERETARRELVSRKEVESALANAGHALRSKLQELPTRSDLIANRTASECGSLLTSWAKEVCDFLSSYDFDAVSAGASVAR